MPYVYRIEHMESGVGPYQHASARLYYKSTLVRHSDDTHPGMIVDQYDRRVRWSEDIHAGFRSIEQLISWFSRENIQDIIDFGGFQLCIYQTDALWYGKYQTVFDKSEAECVDTLTLDELCVLY